MARKKSEPEFVLCVQNECAEGLELRRVYHVLPDQAAAKDGYIRVVDESGEDYLYPARYFVAVELPGAVAKALAASA